MNKIWVISDTHFQHRNIIKFEAEKRPFPTIEEHDRTLIALWNAIVRPNDTVWHLGDVFFGDSADADKLLSRLMGYKCLVMGNHDYKDHEVYTKHFSKIIGAAELKGCILTHIPVHPYQLESRYRKNIHGHMHSKKLDDPRYVCVCVEHTGLQPILLDEVIK